VHAMTITLSTAVPGRKQTNATHTGHNMLVRCTAHRVQGASQQDQSWAVLTREVRWLLPLTEPRPLPAAAPAVLATLPVEARVRDSSSSSSTGQGRLTASDKMHVQEDQRLRFQQSS
jgi:hypothetical protein